MRQVLQCKRAPISKISFDVSCVTRSKKRPIHTPKLHLGSYLQDSCFVVTGTYYGALRKSFFTHAEIFRLAVINAQACL